MDSLKLQKVTFRFKKKKFFAFPIDAPQMARELWN